MDEQNQYSGIFDIPKDFKKLDSERWAEMAARAVIVSARAGDSQVILAVNILESMLVSKIDKDYENAVLVQEAKIREKIKENSSWRSSEQYEQAVQENLAYFKIRALVKLVDRNQKEELDDVDL